MPQRIFKCNYRQKKKCRSRLVAVVWTQKNPLFGGLGVRDWLVDRLEKFCVTTAFRVAGTP